MAFWRFALALALAGAASPVLADDNDEPAGPPVAASPGASPAAPAASSPRPIRVAVYQLKAKDLDAEQLDLVSNSLLSEIRKLSRVSAIGMDEIQAMLLVEEQRQMLGCSDESCLAEIAGALGADYLIVGSMGQVGESSLLSLKRIDMRKAQAVQTFNRRMAGGSGEELLEALGPSVETLFPDYPLRSGLTRGVSAEVVGRWNPPPLDTWVFWTVAGTAAAALATSGIFFWQQQEAEDDFQTLVDRSRDGRIAVAGADLVEAEDRAEFNNKVGLALVGTGAALAVGAGLVALFTDWQGELTITPTLGADGGGVTINGGLPNLW